MKAIWPKSPPKLVASALSGHSALGLALGALMFILCLSGTLVVFHNETERWEQPSAPEISNITPQAVQTAAENALAQIDFQPHHFYVALPTDDKPRMVVSAYEELPGTGEASFLADAQGNLVGGEQHPWTHFLIHLHYYFHLPALIGITFVGGLGAMLLGLIISGFIAHPRIFRDAFTFRLGGAKRLSEADLHNRLSVWGAPFHFVIALSGAMLGLSSVMALFVAAISYEGDTTKVFAPIFGPDQAMTIEREAPLADIATAMANLRTAHPDVAPSFVSMHDPATNAQTLQMNGLHHDRMIYAETYNFSTDGQLTGQVGLSNGAIGQQAFAASYPLHFGSFGGSLIRIAYGVMGVALCIVIATGMNIWFVKRREKGRPAPRLERAWTGTVWGTCLALSIALVASVAGIGEDTLVPLFWSSLVAIVSAAVAAQGNQMISRVLRVATGVALLTAVAIQGTREGAALVSPAGWPVTLAFIALAVAAFGSARGLFTRRTVPVIAPAE